MSDDAPTIEPRPAELRPWVRRLRIAVSVFFGLLGVAFCLLWARSYSWRDNLLVTIAPIAIWLSSEQGESALFISPADSAEPIFFSNSWSLASSYLSRKEFFPFDHDSPRPGGFGVYWFSFEYWGVFAPHWFVTALVAVPIAIHWQTWRFSLRTLLIATTLIALALGLIVWAAR